MAEWSIAVVLKTIVPRGTGGSNPSFSARKLKVSVLRPFFVNRGLLFSEQLFKQQINKQKY